MPQMGTPAYGLRQAADIATSDPAKASTDDLLDRGRSGMARADHVPNEPYELSGAVQAS